MHYHREGYKIIIVSSLLIILADIGVFYFFENFPLVKLFLAIGLMAFLVLIIQFFRVPHRIPTKFEEGVIAPADGKVVVIEEVDESEYFKGRRIQVSIFMSPLNVHANYYPVKGEVSYFKYHPGKYLVAWHPKSSTENEHSTIVVKKANGVEVLFRQIAGAVARRIVCYAKEGDAVAQSEEVGFIKFGSRIDLLLPIDSEILIELGQKVQGRITEIARFKTDI
jgi:phosphatidylserine decarboxylase